MASAKAFMRHNVPLSALVAASLAVVLVSVAGFEFEVGEDRGWKIPNGKEPETYNEWAAKNRFRIGDIAHFKYKKDSVLVVTSANYLKCNTSNPISKFEDGDTSFKFERSGFFYFISGQPGHCGSGQKLIVRVMHPSEVARAPEPAPYSSPAASPRSGGDSGWDWGDWGPPGIVSAAAKISVVSCFITVLAGIFVAVYLFV